MPHTLHVVSHTHWDREWYLTFQQFRMRLVDLIDHLLELLEHDADFRSFHLDAQTIVLEDYLEIRPHNRQRLEQYIREGRIIVGPWYQLNDEFLTSGEATIRSLLVGVRMAQQFGACASIGYLPDQFGNLSQMPQIFRGFGIDNAVFGRGYQLVDERKMEFVWKSPDGSQVTASLMAFWYNNAQHFPAGPQAAQGYVDDLREKMAVRSAVSHLLLMNGVDHLEAQQDLAPILAAVQQGLPQGERIVHSTIEQYTQALRKEVEQVGIALQTHTGELREDRGGSILAGTLSTRMYLKQANHQAQLALERFAEPFAAFAMQVGSPYPQDFLHYAWKLLMKNHPHDSICGCSIDQVHREMMPRFAQVEQIGAELVERALGQIAGRVTLNGEAGGAVGGGETGLVVFNSLNWQRSDPVRAKLVFPLGPATRGNPPRDDSRRVNGITILDPQGREVPFVVTEDSTRIMQVLSPVELPLDQWVQELTVAFIAEDVPACGYQAYRVRPTASMPQYQPWQVGTLDGWQPLLEDVGDVGDEYLYHKPANDLRLELPMLGSLISEERSAIHHSAVYAASWELPAEAAADLAARSAERVSCQVTTRVTRWRGSPRVEYVTTLDNRARDHRVRVVFQAPSGAFQPRPYSVAEGQFDVLCRPLDNPLEREGAATFHPQQNWVALVGQDGASGELRTAAVINQGLPEYEIYTAGETPGIAVTLLRGVHTLSRRDDGPSIETPEAQCLGEHTFQYAFVESAGDWKAGKVWQQAYQFNAPLVAVQTGDQSNQAQRDLPPTLSFMTLEPAQLLVTAIKRAEDDPNRLIVRFFNTTDEPVSGGRVSVRGAKSAQLVNLNEEGQRALGLREGGAVLLDTVGPKQIVTLAFDL